MSLVIYSANQMTEAKEKRNTALRYLFGELREGELDRFEEMLFLSEEQSDFVTNVENDLIDEYLRGEINSEEIEKFETLYLNSESRRVKLNIAKTLHSNLFDKSEVEKLANASQSTFWESFTSVFRLPRPALAGGFGLVIIALFAGSVLLFRSFQERDANRGVATNPSDKRVAQPTAMPSLPAPIVSPRRDSGDKSADAPDNSKKVSRPNAKNSAPNTVEKKKSISKPIPKDREPTKKTNPGQQPAPRVMAFSLMPPTRSGANPVLYFPSGTKSLQISLFDDFDNKFVKYLVELNDSRGKTIWSNQFKALGTGTQQSLSVVISGGLLRTGTYEFAVSGVANDGSVEEVNFYNFEVRRQ